MADIDDPNIDEYERQVRRNEARDAAEAQALLDRYGMFCADKPLLTRIVAREQIWPKYAPDIIRNARRKTERKAADLLTRAEAATGGVAWSEDLVVRAVEYLTGRDDDRATKRNNVGWSMGDTSTGHWCAMTITNGGEQRELAIRIARQILGKYTSQLIAGRVINVFDETIAREVE